MGFRNREAVILLEIRVDPRKRSTSPLDGDRRLYEARLLLEGIEPDRTAWTPAGGSAFAGRLHLGDAATAFPLLYRLRTMLRADPRETSLIVLAGLGCGEEIVADRLATEAFRAVLSRRPSWTCALTPVEKECRVLGAICRTLDVLERGWTASQWEAIVRRDRNSTLQEIGNELGIAYQNVSKRLLAAQYGLHAELLGAASEVFAAQPQFFS